jgi:amino acid transporter
LSFIALVVMYASLAIILATPNLGAVTSGKVADPVFDTLTTQLGRGIAIPVECLFVVGFLASFLALQTSASRMIWAAARDGGLPAARVLSKLSPVRRQPAAAILVTTVVGAALFLLSNVAENIYTIMVNFTSGGFFLSFLFPLLGFVVVLARKQWRSTAFSLRRATMPIAIVALIWATLEFVNISWPRPVYPESYLDWSIVIGIAAIGIVGVIVFVFVKNSIPNVIGQEYLMAEETASASATVADRASDDDAAFDGARV